MSSPSPHFVVVGADKGGVGKTMVARTLADYFRAHGATVRSFDGEYLARHPVTKEVCGTFARFCAGTKVININEPDDQMKVFDGLGDAQVTLLDLPAGALSTTLETLRMLGFFGGIDDGSLRLSVVHVIGSNKASFDEIDTTREAVAGANYVTVLNSTNRSKFDGLPASVVSPVRIGLLNEAAAAAVDMSNKGFAEFCGDVAKESRTMRGYVNAWLRECFKEFDGKELNAL